MTFFLEGNILYALKCYSYCEKTTCPISRKQANSKMNKKYITSSRSRSHNPRHRSFHHPDLCLVIRHILVNTAYFLFL